MSGVYVSGLRVWEIVQERMADDMEMPGFYEQLRGLPQDSRNLAVTVLEGEFYGSRMLLSDGTIVWKTSRTASLDAARRYQQLADDIAGQSAQVQNCGIYTAGSVQVFFEPLGGEKKMVICGGGHVSIPLIRIGRMLGFAVTVLEDRPQFAGNAMQAGASDVLCGPFGEGLDKIRGDAGTFFVIVTRGHRYDQICLESIAKKKHAYIGMIGSRKRTAAVKAALLENGADKEVIERVYTPVGLDIGAKTPEEIAVAIAAQIIQVKNKTQDSSFSEEILHAVLDEANAAEPKVLAVIIRRKGSVPRETGAKMLILADGRCVGTIGGGCAESEIQKKALLMMREGRREMQICCVDMTGSAAEEDGMVCGGIMDVLLEPL